MDLLGIGAVSGDGPGEREQRFKRSPARALSGFRACGCSLPPVFVGGGDRLEVDRPYWPPAASRIRSVLKFTSAAVCEVRLALPPNWCW